MSEIGKRWIPELDGLRGIAILLVMTYHFTDYRPPATSFIDSIVFGATGLGWIGVDLFFVLSGFLITGILLDSKDLPGYLRVFYWRRGLRILPLYYTSVVFFFWIMPFLSIRIFHSTWPTASKEQLWYWLYISNWRTAFYPYICTYLTHFWSLAIEEQFYLFWPFVVLKSSRKSLLRISVAGVLLIWFARNLPWAQALGAAWPNTLYRLTPFRIDTLLLGSCAALVARDAAMIRFVTRWMKPLFAVACTVLALVVYTARSTAPPSAPMTRIGYPALGIIFFSAVVFAALHSGGESRLGGFLRAPLLLNFGKYSYGLYVFNVPIAIVLPRLPIAHWGALFSDLVAAASGIAITYAVARVSWLMIESRFLRLKSRLNHETNPRLAIAALTCLAPQPRKVPA